MICGSAVNYDGRSQGLTAPSGSAQRELIVQAYERARIQAREVEYVVAHGTGTRLGDPVEIAALNEAFGSRPLSVGSVRWARPRAMWGTALPPRGW